VGGNRSPFKDTVKAAAERYPVGRTVKVYYNPSNPSEAVLEPGLWYGNFIFAGIGVVIIGVAYLTKLFADAVAKVDVERAQKSKFGDRLNREL
jgi:hypothetical protein